MFIKGKPPVIAQPAPVTTSSPRCRVRATQTLPVKVGDTAVLSVTLTPLIVPRERRGRDFVDSEVQIAVTAPNGIVIPLEVVRDDTGHYHADCLVEHPGVYFWDLVVRGASRTPDLRFQARYRDEEAA